MHLKVNLVSKMFRYCFSAKQDTILIKYFALMREKNEVSTCYLMSSIFLSYWEPPSRTWRMTNLPSLACSAEAHLSAPQTDIFVPVVLSLGASSRLDLWLLRAPSPHQQWGGDPANDHSRAALPGSHAQTHHSHYIQVHQSLEHMDVCSVSPFEKYIGSFNLSRMICYIL